MVEYMVLLFENTLGVGHSIYVLLVIGPGNIIHQTLPTDYGVATKYLYFVSKKSFLLNIYIYGT